MPNSPKTAARRRAMANERARLNALRRADPSGSIAGARRRAEQAAQRRRNNAARIIQARVRGMLTRAHLANPAWGRTYANVAAGRHGLGHRAVMRSVFERPNNMRAYGARIRAGIRHGPEHHVSGRRSPRWSNSVSRCHGALCELLSAYMPRGASTRTSPRNRRSPRSNNNNNLYR